MTRDEFLSLYEKYLTGQCTPDEIDLLYGYQDGMVLQDNNWDPDLGDKEGIGRRLQQRLLDNMAGTDIAGPGKYKKPIIQMSWLKAAAVICVSSIGFYFFYGNNLQLFNKAGQGIGAQQPVDGATDVAPGTNKATLTLADGRKIELSGEQERIVVAREEIRYADGTGVATNHSVSATYNSLTTPKGGQYQVILPDGTKVWLNAASTLRYPMQFDAAERRVELQGEAYFEVSGAGQSSFIVESAGQEVLVLGTAFSVSAYQGEHSVNTTLVSGRVKVRDVETGSERLLKPGQQSSLSAGGLQVSDTDIEVTTAWKNGLFVFQDDELGTIMRQLERWYNVSFDIPVVPKQRFYGMISRNEPLSRVLKMIEASSNIKFQMEERRIKLKK